MPADQLLNTVLALYQSVHDAPKTDQIIGSTVTLLASLSNPLNLAVLTSELLIAPAIWHRRDGLTTSYRIISVYHTAARHVRQPDEASLPGGRQPGRLGCDDWTKGVVKGADARSNRWQHLLMLTGILMGMQGNDAPKSLSSGLRNTLEEAVVKAANLALERPMQDGPVAAASISVALGFALPLLSESHLSSIHSDALLPNAVWTLTGEEGFLEGHFLSTINNGLSRTHHGDREVIHWPATSTSFHQIQQLDRKPLVAGMGATAKLIMHAIRHARDPITVLEAQDALLEFSRQILDKWQACVLSEVELKTEGERFTPETLQATWPLVWSLLTKVLYSVVAALQALMARCLLDRRLRNDATAPSVATKTLHTLRNLFFISSRDGNGNFQAYSFVNLTSIDILSRYPDAAASLLREIRPDVAGAIPPHPLHKTLDLHYLTLAEHLPIALSTAASESLIVHPASPYIAHPPVTPLMRELFESAHTALLSVLSCPHNSPLATSLVPFYVDSLFSSFPEHISPRQFRVAFKTVTQIVSPPFPVSATNPDLAETLLEMVRFRAANASTSPLPAAEGEAGDVLSEQSALVLALLDALPFLDMPLFEAWLPLAAESVAGVADPQTRLPVRKRLWQVLESGEMDVDRSSLAVSWWYARGGRELVLKAERGLGGEVMMSGALETDKKDEDRAKL
ncbi:hypothetical protein VUR80DRAFT_9035 [Thermomyces stellatus]